MSEKPRALPQWMTTENKTSMKSQRNRKAARSVFYCMNESELVEAAVSYLCCSGHEDKSPQPHQQIGNKGNKITKKKKPLSQLEKGKQTTHTCDDESSDCCNDQETLAYVSETDLDITEVETLPYTKSPQCSQSERSEPRESTFKVCNVDVDTGEKEKPAESAQEDEAFQIVRDIFFT